MSTTRRGWPTKVAPTVPGAGSADDGRVVGLAVRRPNWGWARQSVRRCCWASGAAAFVAVGWGSTLVTVRSTSGLPPACDRPLIPLASTSCWRWEDVCRSTRRPSSHLSCAGRGPRGRSGHGVAGLLLRPTTGGPCRRARVRRAPGTLTGSRDPLRLQVDRATTIRPTKPTRVVGHLGGRLQLTHLGPEVDPQLPGRGAGLGNGSTATARPTRRSRAKKASAPTSGLPSIRRSLVDGRRYLVPSWHA